jgi:sporulation-control protein spo0M
MNKNQVIVYLICGGLGVVVIGIVLYYILRWLKGSVRLEVENRAYRPGDIIHGVVHLKCRQSVEANRFFVALVCHQVTHERHEGKNRTHRHEVMRQEVDVAPPGPIAAGTEQRFEFAIPIPGPQAPLTTGNQTVDTVLRAVAGLGSNRRLEWSLEARVEARGVDLAQRRRISINLV